MIPVSRVSHLIFIFFYFQMLFINSLNNWEPNEDGFNKATSHILRKFFNTQLINAGMAEEIREHMRGHKLKDRVRDAYFLADPDELRKLT